jgi:hypothetical protein
MSKLIPIKYHKRNYPFGIEPQIREVAGHFDVVRADTSFPPIVEYLNPIIILTRLLGKKKGQLNK